MDFRKGTIEGVKVSPVRKYADERGWLMEVFRHDELDPEFHPAMGYASLSYPGVLRGPHEHVDQADFFVCAGPGDFKWILWDNRPASPTFGNRMELFLGACTPASLLVPKGVVHCYRCIGQESGWILNVPNRLYAGEGRKGPADEIRHEDDPESPFVKDERAIRGRLR
jgi:dTDP-4-dehydrorhamnose 3,5-epimerase